jgi:phosphatidate cytidylyltransferase
VNENRTLDPSLRNRLTFGPIMMAALLGLLYLDHYAQQRTRAAHHVKETDERVLWSQWRAGYERQGEPLPATRPVNPPEIHYGVAGVGLLLLLLIILPLATEEVARLFTAENVRPYRFISAAGSGSLVIHAFLTQFPTFRPVAASTLAFIIVFVMLLSALRRAWMKETQGAIVHMAGTVLATLYLGGLGWFLMALRVKHSFSVSGVQGSTMIIVMILLVVKFTDIGAFFGGKTLGRHKLIPWLSPGKTWEGLACGMLTAGLVGAILAMWINPPVYPLPWWKGFIFGVVIGGIGQLGDLLESLMKRDADVKDSGKLVPGFGGILDIIDSPLLAAPFAYLMFSLF